MSPSLLLFFFHDPPTTEIYTLSLHDALPICRRAPARAVRAGAASCAAARNRRRQHSLAPGRPGLARRRDRKSTRLNSSHVEISYAVFCLKKKKKQITSNHPQASTDDRDTVVC